MRALIVVVIALLAVPVYAAKDRDGDGITDDRDRCPDEPEDKDGFIDDDGCPDPDNDADGVPDARDKCSNEAEDRDLFQDDDGCPDPDNDADGIVDVNDKCPSDPEDRDGFQDADGCPDPDNDADGIVDAQDRCPNEPENKNGFEDDDGCPDQPPSKPGKPGKSPSEAAKEGTLDVNASPWADVVVDGKSIGRTPLRGLRLAAGTHTVTLTNGSAKRTQTVEIQAGKTVNVVVKMK